MKMSFKKLAVILAIFMVCYLENVNSKAIRQADGINSFFI